MDLYWEFFVTWLGLHRISLCLRKIQFIASLETRTFVHMWTVIDVIMMQDDTRADLQCIEAVHGDESEVVWQLYTAVQSRDPEVSSHFTL